MSFHENASICAIVLLLRQPQRSVLEVKKIRKLFESDNLEIGVSKKQERNRTFQFLVEFLVCPGKTWLALMPGVNVGAPDIATTTAPDTASSVGPR